MNFRIIELRDIAKLNGIKGYSKLCKFDLLKKLDYHDIPLSVYTKSIKRKVSDKDKLIYVNTKITELYNEISSIFINYNNKYYLDILQKYNSIIEENNNIYSVLSDMKKKLMDIKKEFWNFLKLTTNVLNCVGELSILNTNLNNIYKDEYKYFYNKYCSTESYNEMKELLTSIIYFLNNKTLVCKNDTTKYFNMLLEYLNIKNTNTLSYDEICVNYKKEWKSLLLEHHTDRGGNKEDIQKIVDIGSYFKWCN